MYVCICNAITEDQIQKLIAKGMSIDDILKMSGAGSDCGSCIDAVKKLINKESK